jgi:predicted phosphodiesterase
MESKGELMTKIGVIADVHGNALALAAVLDDARRRGVERLVDLGDVLYGPLQPLETYKLFQSAPLVAGIAGNQDRKVFNATRDELAANRNLAFVVGDLGEEPIAWLRALPPTAIVDDDLFLCHGTPTSDTTYLLEDVRTGHPVVRDESEILKLLGGVQQPVILCGHSHIPRVVRLGNGQTVVNPGSVGLPAYDDAQPVPHAMETYSPHASYAILERGAAGWAAGWHVALHRVAYDWNEAAEQAFRRDAPDWATGIATGRMDRLPSGLAGTTVHSVTY